MVHQQTGLAQISGRDELEIPVKAKLDGEYAKNLSFAMDCKCFFGSVGCWNVSLALENSLRWPIGDKRTEKYNVFLREYSYLSADFHCNLEKEMLYFNVNSGNDDYIEQIKSRIDGGMKNYLNGLMDVGRNYVNKSITKEATKELNILDKSFKNTMVELQKYIFEISK